jgi:phosphoglycolate phosphatase-like HAD superfamily hydrolase
MPAPGTSPTRLVLFDVDGTLITARGAGRRALSRAMEEAYGVQGPGERYDWRGQTDPRIVLDVMGAAGVPPDRVREGLDRCFEAYARHLAREVAAGAVEALPGVTDLVPWLGGEPRVLLGLVTGNIEAAARIKLQPVGLWDWFRTGAFGSDDADRRRLPSLAARRAQALTGRRFGPEDVVVVGDTPRDIECARAFGARAVAVATGLFPRDELAAHAPDLLLDDLGDPERAAEALLGG